jgi:hypothetical protein
MLLLIDILKNREKNPDAREDRCRENKKELL